MNIANFTIQIKKSPAILIIILAGLIAAVYLVQNKQIFKSRATEPNIPFEIIEDTSQQNKISCNETRCTTKSLKIIIRPKLNKEITSPVEAFVE